MSCKPADALVFLSLFRERLQKVCHNCHINCFVQEEYFLTTALLQGALVKCSGVASLHSLLCCIDVFFVYERLTHMMC